MRPIFVGNFGYDTRQSELERLFAKYGRVERIDMKSGILQFLCYSMQCHFKRSCYKIGHNLCRLYCTKDPFLWSASNKLILLNIALKTSFLVLTMV